jgi:hypothetical protein
MERPKVDYRHTYLLFALLGLALFAALVVRALLVPDSYGRDGAYRADAPLDERVRTPRHLGEAACAECHEEQVGLHDKDAHAAVQCEVCHGAGDRHVADPEQVKPAIPKGKEPCLTCHHLLAARPGWFPQIIWREHYRFVGVRDQETDCTACHDPHEPLYMDRDLRSARMHPLIHRCRDCHIGRVNETLPRPDDHPPIFECSYCHPAIVADAQARPHSKVQCTTCHIFFVESEFSGRILRDADPRFCLLCHREADFRSDSAPPGIGWPAHLDDVAESEADRKKRCIDCHQDKIHLGKARDPACDGVSAPGQQPAAGSSSRGQGGSGHE